MKKILIVLLAMIMILSFVACAGNNDDTREDDNDNGNDPWTQGESDEQGKDDDFEFNIKDDDNTVVITIGNLIQVYTHDGVNVTGYTTYVDYEDADTARLVAANMKLNDSYYSSLGVKSITVKGTYIITEYNKDGFSCETYEELQDLVALYKQIQE